MKPTVPGSACTSCEDHKENLLRGPIPPSGDVPRLAQFIGGSWMLGESDEEFRVINPALGTSIQQFTGASSEQVDAAATAAERAFQTWARAPAVERASILSRAGDLMRARVEKIALQLTLEQGKPLSQARDEIIGSAAVMSWFGEQAKRAGGRTVPSRDRAISQLVDPRPVGPVAVFTPWNSPLGTSVRTVAAALAAGCSVVLKPASETPNSVSSFASTLIDVGVPEGVFNLLLGKAADISVQLIKHPAIRKISFTGSVAAGRMLAREAGESVKPIALELGGHAPVLIFEDVDIAEVARQAAAAKYDNAGQICISPSRFFVHRGAYSRFIEAIVREAERLQLGEGWVDGVDMGPLANARRLIDIERLVQGARSDGAAIATGGEQVGQRGYFYKPTVLIDVPDSAAIMREEPFGPVASITPFDDEAEVLARANALPYGLAGYAFTSDPSRLDRLAAGVDVGMIGLNNFQISKPELPFTGVKDSGFGYACGEEGLGNFLVHHTVTRRARP
jgi:succinate-semialdehyde dehydrogenase / glutarate-semialdehyde dehydrogenase